MEIDRLELQAALAIVKPGLAKKEILEQSTSFAFIKDRVVTYNDEISISHPVSGMDFEGAIKAEELYGLLTKLSQSKVDISVNDSQLSLRCGRVKAGLTLTNEIKLPITKEIGHIHNWEAIPNPAVFSEHLSFAMQTCSSDLSEPKMTCVHIRSNGIIQASDGYRLFQGVSEEIPIPDFLIPAIVIAEVIKIEPTEIADGGTWIHFKNESGTVISCRPVAMEYVAQDKIDDVLDVEGKAEIKFPAKVEEMLDRARQFAKRDFIFDEIIKIKIAGGKVVMFAESDETNSWIEEERRIESDIDVEFTITPKLFEDILKQTQSFTLSKDMRKVKFSGDNWEYVIMLRGK